MLVHAAVERDRGEAGVDQRRRDHQFVIVERQRASRLELGDLAGADERLESVALVVPDAFLDDREVETDRVRPDPAELRGVLLSRRQAEFVRPVNQQARERDRVVERQVVV